MIREERVNLTLVVSIVVNAILLGIIVILYTVKIPFLKPLPNVESTVEKPLNRYAYDTLRNETFAGKPITIGKPYESDANMRQFTFTDGEYKVTGLLYLPEKSETPRPVIVSIRGFVDPAAYKPGIGSRNVSLALAKAGYIVLSPDFLGYGGSDMPSGRSLEERFQTYTTLLSLLADIEYLEESLRTSKIDLKVAKDAVGIWAHSNGGQIAITALEITGKDYPTVLWAPVTAPFPHSILYFSDEYEDHGRALRRVVADFEKTYDIARFTVVNYYDWIKAPIQVHQGTADEAVPQKWSDTFVETMKDKKKDIEYFVYEGADHNMQPAWNQATSRAIEFFDKKLQ